MYELIITEKPSAAKKIAEALAEGKPIRETNQGVSYYKVTHQKKDIVVACAVGHLYSVAEKDPKGWTYPVFDISWKLSSELSKDLAYSKKYYATIKKLAKEADSFVVACDYDTEGEVIGLNCIRFICNQKDAARMKFSTLTTDELIESYENKAPRLNWGQALAGETRHFLDWLYGINLSRALSLSVKSFGNGHKVLSIGRVQGPALKIVVDREEEIGKFVPEPFWQLQLTGTAHDKPLEAWHE
ncbi:DNA topoisomerase I, partial [Candidatus Woesearchaeota archaeon CG_4_10_14_0_8_um_filter_47_5]